MINRKPDHDNNLDHDNDNDKTKRTPPGIAATPWETEPTDRAIAPAPAAGALISLTALQAVLNSVDTGSVSGRSGLPMLQFKREGDGSWMYGQQRTIVEDGSCWAINPLTFKWGYICFSNDNKVAGERLVPVSQPMPDITELPDKGFEWNQQWAVNLKCIDGTDAGTETVYKPTTVGGISGRRQPDRRGARPPQWRPA